MTNLMNTKMNQLDSLMGMLENKTSGDLDKKVNNKGRKSK